MVVKFELPNLPGNAGKWLRVDPTETFFFWDAAPPPPGGAYQFVENNFIPVAQRRILNFSSLFAVTDDVGNLSTDIDIDVANLATDNTFITDLTNNSTFITDLTSNTNFITDITNIVTTGGGVLFQTDGFDNGSQAKLNLQAGLNVVLTDDGFGNITIDATGGGGGGHIIAVDGSTFAAEPELNFINFFIGTDVPGVSTNINLDTAAIANDNTFITTLVSNSTFITSIISITGAGGVAKIDQTPSNGTYGLLAGTVNGSNTTFTVSAGAYVSGSLLVFRQGVAQLQGVSDEWTETLPSSGTFDFVNPPLAGEVITVIYQEVGVGSGGTTVQRVVHQVAHGFTADQVIRPSNSDSIYTLSQADTSANAEVEGIVTLVIDADHFVLVTEGYYTMGALPGGATASSVLFLDDAVAGGMTVTAPTTPPTVNKPIAQVIDASTKLIHFHNYRGQNNQTIPSLAFGTWDNSSYTHTIVYQAPSDGFVQLIMTFTAGGTGASAGEILSDSSNPPTTIRAANGEGLIAAGQTNIIMAPVKSGEYFKTIGASPNTSYAVNFLPII